MGINLALRFLLEVCALVSLAYWGFQSSQGILLKLVLGIGTPLLIALIWSVFGSPKAPIPAKGVSRLFLELLIFGLATLALYSSGKTTLAVIYAITVLLNRLLLYIWDQ